MCKGNEMDPLAKALLVFVLFTIAPLFVIASWFTCQEGNWILTYVSSAASSLAAVLGFHVLNRK